MSKKTFVIFGLLVLFFAVLIPWLAFRSDGDASRGAQKIPAHLKEGQTLFQINCGNCHALYAAGSDGNFAPDLDDLLASPPPGDQTAIEGIEQRVLNAIDDGVDSTTTAGRMPPGILSGEQAQEVAEFVANTAGEG